MATCGYICPVCEGSGYTDEGKDCDYCKSSPPSSVSVNEIPDEEWMEAVHNRCACSDIGEPEKPDTDKSK